MSQLIETIKIFNGRVYNIKYHNQRCNRSRLAIFGSNKPINLRRAIQIPLNMRKGLFKCRMTYGETIHKIEFEPYKLKSISSVKCVYTDHLDYQHKFQDREALKSLYQERGKHDDIIIINNQYISDGYYTNLAFHDGTSWFTPRHHLLAGTMRQKLVDKGQIKVKSLKVKDLKNFESVTMFNALIGFKTIMLSTSSIYE